MSIFSFSISFRESIFLKIFKKSYFAQLRAYYNFFSQTCFKIAKVYKNVSGESDTWLVLHSSVDKTGNLNFADVFIHKILLTSLISTISFTYLPIFSIFWFNSSNKYLEKFFAYADLFSTNLNYFHLNVFLVICYLYDQCMICFTLYILIYHALALLFKW